MRRNQMFLFIALFAAAIVADPVAGNAAYKEINVKNGGSVSGKLTFSGDLPADASEHIQISKNPEVCGDGPREILWLDVKDGALRQAFVFLDEVKEGKKWPTPKGGKYLINQEKCAFEPWASILQRGPLTIRNSDKGIMHNINLREMINVETGRPVRRTIFNLGQPDVGDLEKDVNPRRSSYLSVNCEAHNFMFAFMLAPEHPYAVVVGDDGSYTIDNIPPGTYTLKAWHPKLGVQKVKIRVSAGGKVKQNFTFKKN